MIVKEIQHAVDEDATAHLTSLQDISTLTSE